MSLLTDFVPEFDKGYDFCELTYLNTSEQSNVPGNGLLKCDGSAVSRTTYSNLFNVLGLYPNALNTTTISSSVITSDSIKEIQYGGVGGPSVYGAISSLNVYATSTNSISWSSNAIGASGFNTTIIAEGVYVIAGTAGKLYTSTNAINWTSRTSGTAQAINALTHGNGTFVYGGNAGAIASSLNGTSWTTRTSGTSSQITALTYGSSLYVYAGVNGVLASSTNAANWTLQTSGTTSDINALTYGNGLYVYAGNGGVLATSTNATNWVAAISGTTSAIRKLTYDNGVYMYLADGGTLGISHDGVKWRTHTIEINTTAIIFYSDKLVTSNNNTNADVIIRTPFDYNYSTNFVLPNTANITLNSEYLYIKY